ncbi:MAG: hypothetical protein ACE5GQ_07400 [Nitrospinales bacterium]
MFRNPQIVVTAVFVVLTALTAAPGAWAVDKFGLGRSSNVAAKRTVKSAEVKMCRRECKVQLREMRRKCELYKNRQDHNDMNKQSARIAFGRCLGKVRKVDKRCKAQCQ